MEVQNTSHEDTPAGGQWNLNASQARLRTSEAHYESWKIAADSSGIDRSGEPARLNKAAMGSSKPDAVR